MTTPYLIEPDVAPLVRACDRLATATTEFMQHLDALREHDELAGTPVGLFILCVTSFGPYAQMGYALRHYRRVRERGGRHG